MEHRPDRWSTPFPMSENSSGYFADPYNQWGGRVYPPERIYPTTSPFGWGMPPQVPPRPYPTGPPRYPSGYYQYNQYFNGYSTPPHPYFQKQNWWDSNGEESKTVSYVSETPRSIYTSESQHCESCFKIFGESSTSEQYMTYSSKKEHALKHAEEKESSDWRRELQRCFPNSLDAEGAKIPTPKTGSEENKQAGSEQQGITHKLDEQLVKHEVAIPSPLANEEDVIADSDEFRKGKESVELIEENQSRPPAAPFAPAPAVAASGNSNGKRGKKRKRPSLENPMPVSKDQVETFSGANLPHEDRIKQIIQGLSVCLTCKICFRQTPKSLYMLATHAISHMEDSQIFMCLRCGFKGKHIRAHWNHRHSGSDFNSATFLFCEPELNGKLVRIVEECFGCYEQTGNPPTSMDQAVDSNFAAVTSASEESLSEDTCGPQSDPQRKSEEFGPSLEPADSTCQKKQELTDSLEVGADSVGRVYSGPDLPHEMRMEELKKRSQKGLMLTCQICGCQVSKSTNNIFGHMMSHATTRANNIFLCRGCGIKSKNIRRHWYGHHKGVPFSQCDVEFCNPEFGSAVIESWVDKCFGKKAESSESLTPDASLLVKTPNLGTETIIAESSISGDDPKVKKRRRYGKQTGVYAQPKTAPSFRWSERPNVELSSACGCALNCSSNLCVIPELFKSLKLEKAGTIVCRKCEKQLSGAGKEHLLYHVYSHSDVPLHNCRLCSASTSYLPNLFRHFKKRHPEQEVKPQTAEDRRVELDSKLAQIFDECFMS